MPKNQKVKVPDWVDTENEQADKPNTPAVFRRQMSDNNPENWYGYSHPIVVAAKEWSVERSKVMVPSRKKKALIRVEIRRKADQPLGMHGYRDLEEGSAVSNWDDVITDGDVIVFNVLSLKSEGARKILAKASSFTRELSLGKKTSSSSDTVSTLGIKGVDGGVNMTNALTDEWVVAYSTPISKTAIKRDVSRCTITLEGMGQKSNESFTAHFESEDESRTFVRFIRLIKTTHLAIAQKTIKNTIDSKSITSSTKSIDFLIEIISATDLPPARNGKISAYVVVRYGGTKIHETESVRNRTDPIWTIKTKSMFIFTLYPEEYYNSDLCFEVRDVNQSFRLLGQVLLSPKEIIKTNKNGKRFEKNLKNLQMGSDMEGFLAIRIKRATQADKDFFDAPAKQHDAVRRRQSAFISPLYSKQNPTLQLGRKKKIEGEDYYFVRPMDPSKNVSWLTKEQIEETCKKPSEKWVEAGSGDLGQLFVEVLSCDNLPDLDFGLARNKTDAFACFVFEDAVVTTDVVRDTNNPRFMPWTRRAFKFHVQHISSVLYIGVFDHDFNGMKYDPVGRVSIPLHKFTPGTVYYLSYDLYDSSEVSRRRLRGQLNIRMSISWKGQRSLFFNSLLKKHEEHTVNFTIKKEYDFAEYTVHGKYDQREYDLKTLLAYTDELMQYQAVLNNVLEGLKTVIFWRGHYEVTLLFCIKMKIPLHSFVMLAFGIVLTEFPQYSVSVFFASIAWLMLGQLGNSHKRPSMWLKPPLFKNLLLRFITSGCRPTTIDPHQSEEEDLIYVEKRKSLLAKNMQMSEEFWNGIKNEFIELDDTKMRTLYRDAVVKPFRIELFKKQLFPLQRRFAQVLHALRYSGKIFSWDLMHHSFWITVGAIAMSILTFHFWGIFFLWLKRFIFYGLLGPWNKVVDINYFQKLEKMTEEELEERRMQRKRLTRNRFNLMNIRKQRGMEELVKSAAMKEHMFGKHLLTVPNIRKPERFPSNPLPNSYAIPDRNQLEKSFGEAKEIAAVTGQHVSGTFVPDNLNEHISNSDAPLHANEKTPLSDDEGGKYGTL